ncbi:MAG TPA: glycosyltransferase family 87 protein [Candidatus Binatus sp.]|uniref:glycosyltransferase family 87 protein n=1 Tax=Candidatus Binatus sp. TaxID=2811406 RepID=UPI002B459A94|nr:glycosyltransferase family 87 protein [Candidatus Binatus sp.]HKN12354.1 glycosyltransferase family 87 protein [Candidatus Binatus sp.]
MEAANVGNSFSHAVKVEINAGTPSSPGAAGSNGFSSPNRARSFVDSLREARWINPYRARVYPRLLCASYLAVFVVWLVLRPGGALATLHPVGGDFPPFWAASSLTIGGHPAAVYDHAKLYAAEKAVLGDKDPGYQPFVYPPMFLVIVLPLSILPYNDALILWTLVGLAAYLTVMWKIAPRCDVLWAALAFPGALLTILDGQNGLITVALFGGGLLLLERRPWVAGALFGLLCYKPQFGILLPLVFVAARQWRAATGAALMVAAFAGLSAALFGVETWRAFLDGIPLATRSMLEQGDVGFGKIQSIFGAARLWGASLPVSYAMQAVVSVLAAGAVLWVWLKSGGYPVKAAALAAGTLLVTPYIVDYDLVLLALPIAWLSWDAVHSAFLPWEKSILFLAWLFPLFARVLSMFASLPLTPLVLALLMLAIIRRGAAAEAVYT